MDTSGGGAHVPLLTGRDGAQVSRTSLRSSPSTLGGPRTPLAPPAYAIAATSSHQVGYGGTTDRGGPLVPGAKDGAATQRHASRDGKASVNGSRGAHSTSVGLPGAPQHRPRGGGVCSAIWGVIARWIGTNRGAVLWAVVVVGFMSCAHLWFWHYLRWEGWLSLTVVLVLLGFLIADVMDAAPLFLLALGVIMVTQSMSVDEALKGFSSPTVFAIACLYAVSAAVKESTLLDYISRAVLGTPSSTRIALLRLLPTVAVISMFVNNTPIVAIFTPLVERWAGDNSIPLTHLLMPMNAAIILGGMCSQIGTSVNLVVTSLAENSLPPGALVDIDMFTSGQAAGFCALFCIIYMVLFTERLLPKVGNSGGETLRDQAMALRAEQEFETLLVVQPNSEYVGQTFAGSKLSEMKSVRLLGVTHPDDAAAAARREGRDGDAVAVDMAGSRASSDAGAARAGHRSGDDEQSKVDDAEAAGAPDASRDGGDGVGGDGSDVSGDDDDGDAAFETVSSASDGLFNTISISALSPQHTVLRAGSVLRLAAPAGLLSSRVYRLDGLQVAESHQLGKLNKGSSRRDRRLVVAVVSVDSFLIGRTAHQTQFRRMFGAVVLAVWRKGHHRAGWRPPSQSSFSSARRGGSFDGGFTGHDPGIWDSGAGYRHTDGGYAGEAHHDGAGADDSVGRRRGFVREASASSALGLNSAADDAAPSVSTMPLKAGDSLLLEADSTFDTQARTFEAFVLVSDVSGPGGRGSVLPRARPRHAALAAALLVAIPVLAGSSGESLGVVALMAVFVFVMSGTITAQAALRSVSGRTLLVVGCALGLGQALVKLGAAQHIATALAALVSSSGELAPLIVVFIGTATLSNCINPVASVTLMFPISKRLADLHGGDPNRPAIADLVFVLMIAGSCCFVSPFSYQTNMMVSQAAGYTPRDFLRFGTPLLVICCATTVAVGALLGWGPGELWGGDYDDDDAVGPHTH